MVDRLDADAIPAQVCGNSYAALHKVVAKALFRCVMHRLQHRQTSRAADCWHLCQVTPPPAERDGF